MNTNKKLKVACIQLNSNQNVAENLAKVFSFAEQAAEQGAQWIALPENAFCHPYDKSQQAALDEVLPVLQEFCSQRKVWMFAGTIPVLAKDDSGKVYSALHVINDQGEIKAVYKKIHLFDVHVADEGVDYRESDTFIAGDEAIVVQTPWGNVGLAVCYDFRFPELFLAMEKYQPIALITPSAFTLHTGKKHWQNLLSARALDNFAWILAPNQTGAHRYGANDDGDKGGVRETFGHSSIVDPNGVIKDQIITGEGVLTAVIDLEVGAKLKKNIPLHQHRKISLEKFSVKFVD